MREQVTVADPHATAGSAAAEKSHLMEIVGKYAMSKEDIAGAYCGTATGVACTVRPLAVTIGLTRRRGCVFAPTHGAALIEWKHEHHH